jgi:MFS family permease
MMAPLREPVFRRIWISSLFSNLGQQMQAVAAAWTMLQITHKADLVAMVQTAAMLPIMLLAIAAGAVADMYDRRRVALAALILCLGGASLLAAVAAAGLISPSLILLCVFITGTGISLYSPAWQASAAEIVGVRAMPAAVALYSLSNNAARSIGPALGGIVIAASGMVLAFSLNAALYIPIIVALFLWKRKAVPPRLPPERLDRAMQAGLRYVYHSPPIRRVILRALITATGGAAVYSMMPLVANGILHGGPGTYGILLGAFGLGAVAFALTMGRIRTRFASETVVRVCSIIQGASLLIAAFSPFLLLTATAMLAAGGVWMILISSYNVSVQLSAPRWVSGRALATFQAAIAGGLAGGAILWGRIATDHGVTASLIVAALLMLLSPLLGGLLAMPEDVAAEAAPPVGGDPVVQMALTGRSGPLAIEIEYRIRNDDARAFYHAMREVRRSRERNGAFNMTLARDITDPELWVERFHYPTWNDYLRARDRPTVDDRQLRDHAVAFHIGSEPPRVRRMLERPIGSVRWREDALDPGEVMPLPPSITSG